MNALIGRGFLVALAGLLSGCGDSPKPLAPPIPRVRVFEVGLKASGQIRTISGQLAAADRSPLSFGIAGTVDRVNVSQGDLVEAEQVLATLDPEPLRLNLRQARSGLAAARARSIESEKAYERASALLTGGVISQADAEVATANVRSARASLRGAQAEVEQSERDLRRGELRSPFDGRIAERFIEPFQETGANEAAFVLLGSDALIVKLSVPEVLIRNVDYAQQVRVTFPTDLELEQIGVVSLIAARAGSGNSFPVEIQLPTSEADLRPGMTASVTFNFDAYLEGQTVYLIPISTVAIEVDLREVGRTQDELVSVFIVDSETSRLRVAKIHVGGLRGNQLEVYDGLKAGDKVVSAGVSFLRDGMEVEIWSPEQGLTGG